MLKNVFATIIIIWLALTLLFTQSFYARINIDHLSHYPFLAQSLVEGRLDVTEQIRQNFTEDNILAAADYSIVDGRYYVYLGIFPALVTIPLLFLGANTSMVLLVVVFLSINIYLIRRIVGHYIDNRSLMLTIMILVSSPILTSVVFFGPWYLAGLIASALGLSFVWFYLIKSKPFGIFFLCPLFLTRPDTVFFFLIPFYRAMKNRFRGRETIFSVLTALVALSAFGAYNYGRFGSPFEAGYKYAYILQDRYRTFRVDETPKDYFVSNAIYMTINPPIAKVDDALRFEPPFFELSRFGVGLLFVLPWILPYFLLNKKILDDWLYLLVIFLILITILAFTGEGSFQIGPRYANDFFPLLIFVYFKWLSKNKKKIPLFYKLLAFSFVLNLYFHFLVISGNIRRG